MKAAITEWQGRVAPVFDVAGTALVFGELDGLAATLPLPDGSPMGKLDLLKRHGVHVLICGAITRRAREHAMAIGLRVNAFVSGEIDEVWTAWKTGRLQDACYSMPGCGRCRRLRGECDQPAPLKQQPAKPGGETDDET